MGILLKDTDEYTHAIGPESNWNESRYVDFWDQTTRIGGWLRIGNRPNEGHAEMSVALNLPDGRQGFMFGRPKIQANELSAGGQSWSIDNPWRERRVTYSGDMLLLDDPWLLADPKRAFAESERTQVSLDLALRSNGLQSVMGFDQDHIDRIFLPGQAALHYQQLAHTTGQVRVGDQSWAIDGRGGMDHSWGPRNWHAKIYLRWLIAYFDDDYGFMLVRAVGPSKTTRSGFVWEKGQFHLVDDFDMHNSYAGEPNFELRNVELLIRSGQRQWQATGSAQNWLPLRHRQTGADGKPALLRIVKSPAEWVDGEGKKGQGMLEYHDLMIDGRPVGLHD